MKTFNSFIQHQFALILIPPLIAIIGYIIQNILFNILSHYASTDLVGDIGITLRVILLISTVILLGTNIISQRYFSNLIKSDVKADIYQFLGWNYKLLFRNCAIAIVLILIITMIICLLEYLDIYTLDIFHLSFYLLLCNPIAAIAATMIGFFLCNRNVYLYTLFNSVVLYLFILILFLLLILFNIKINYLTASIVLYVTYFLSVIVEYHILKSLKPYFNLTTLFHVLSPKYVVTSTNIKKYHPVSLRLFYNKICNILLIACGIFILEIIDKNEKLIGVYAVILIINRILHILPKYIFSSLRPQINYLTEVKPNPEVLQNKWNSYMLVNLLIIIIIALTIIIFSKDILRIFGLYYSIEGHLALIILTFSYTIFATTLPLEALLSLSNNEKKLMISNYISLGFMIILTLILIYMYSLVGAVLASAITMLFRGAIFIVIIRKNIKIKSLIFL
ncbi:polysaccharide biosynthesis C-terminal domain-containing protein [Thiotrichales bacterium 19S3-7]|nr:polysaccharide biosynthesis C-terminal domain-containing protein [Thiotrichales bacterium 19S3-7]MCF6802119.1 polysaccharide biosynthesis C-terminal domain-containing protein [Thiotrichales bacterium 19S3-11]